VAPHTFTRLIPVTGPSGDIYYPEIAYPYVEPIFSSVLAGVLSALIPVVVMLVSQLWIQSFDDFSHGVLGLAYSMVTGTCFQVILKKTIGGLRPHFLAVCQPVIPPLEGGAGVGYQNIMWTTEQICTGDAKRVKNALESFPSGHSEVAFAGLGYLAIYLFAHLQIRSTRRRRGSYWRMLFIVAPLLLATYLASTLVLGYHHHGYDVIFGALIGVTMAVFGYRMVFRGVWDPKWNTVPVTRNTRNDETSESLEMPRRSQELLNGNTAYEGASHDGQHGPKQQPV
jgi:diacylglycerol diphosphate phosphatase / phosphatidate phosphatase